MTTFTETDACLLSYDLTSYPNPLTTGSHTPTPGTRSEQPTADIDLVISNSGLRDVYCSRITIVLPIGTLAQDLASDGQSINAYVQPADVWTLVPVQDDVLLAIPTTETAHFPAGASTCKTFTLTPAGGGIATVNTDGLHIRLTNIHVNAQPGIARITIEEHTTDNDQDPTPRRTHLTLAKYPGRSTGALDHPGVGRDLIAFKANSTEPAILIDSGTPIDLRWYHEATDTHTLYYNGKTKTFGADPVHGYQTFPLKAENGDCPTRDTTYVLHTARATQEAGIVDRWDTLTVTVNNPTLNALTVSNELQANGDVTVEQGKTLTVNGDIAIPSGGGKLDVFGALVAEAGRTNVWPKAKIGDNALTLGDNNSLTVTANDITIPSGGGKLDVFGALVAEAGRTNVWPKAKIGDNALTLGDYNSLTVKDVTANDVTANSITANNITIPSGAGKLDVFGALVAEAGRTNVWPKAKIGDNALTLGDNNSLTASGERIVRNGDVIQLKVTDGKKDWFLYCPYNASWDSDTKSPKVVGGAAGLLNSQWRVEY